MNSSRIQLCVRDLAWRSSEETVTFMATMYIKRCGRQLLEKCWSVSESHTTFKVDMPSLRKSGNNHGTSIVLGDTRIALRIAIPFPLITV